jgi:hypothetical protein
VYLTDIPRIPGSLAVILPLTEALRQRNLIATGPLGSQNDRALGLQRWNSQVSRAQGAPLPVVVSRICPRLPVMLVPAVPAIGRSARGFP